MRFPTGDDNRDPIDYFGRHLEEGSYTLESDIFSERRLRGDLVVSRTVEFEAKHCDPEPPQCGSKFSAYLSGDEEVPPVHTDVSGDAHFYVDSDEETIQFEVEVLDNGEHAGLLGAAGAHIHCAPAGANGPVVAFLAGVVPGGLAGEVTFSGTLKEVNIVDPTCGSTIEELVDSFCNGNAYVNIHSSANPPGEVRGQIAPYYDD